MLSLLLISTFLDEMIMMIPRMRLMEGWKEGRRLEGRKEERRMRLMEGGKELYKKHRQTNPEDIYHIWALEPL